MSARALFTRPNFPVAVRGRLFHAADTPFLRHAAGEFTSGFEEGTLQFFDAVLPGCDRMIDCGGFVGFTSLYAATHVARVDVFEPSPVNFGMLEANLAVNPELAGKISPHNHALGERDARMTLYGKGAGDSGSSLYEHVQRGSVIRGRPEAEVVVRDADAVLRDIGIDRRTLLKIDIEGAEYQVIPAIAPLLRQTRPFVHVSFHPFNIVVSDDEYVNSVARLRAALAVTEVLEPFRFMYIFADNAWTYVEKQSRPHFLRHYLLAPKPVARVATPQYGFTDAVAFSDESISALGATARA